MVRFYLALLCVVNIVGCVSASGVVDIADGIVREGVSLQQLRGLHTSCVTYDDLGNISSVRRGFCCSIYLNKSCELAEDSVVDWMGSNLESFVRTTHTASVTLMLTLHKGQKTSELIQQIARYCGFFDGNLTLKFAGKEQGEQLDLESFARNDASQWICIK